MHTPKTMEITKFNGRTVTDIALIEHSEGDGFDTIRITFDDGSSIVAQPWTGPGAIWVRGQTPERTLYSPRDGATLDNS